MIDEDDNPRPDLPPQKWEWLEKLNEPVLPALVKFVHGCSKDPNERTLAVTLLVTSLCQLAGRRMMPRMPSTLVVNARELSPDPLDLLAGLLIPEPSKPTDGICKHGPFLGGTAKDAPWVMARAIEMKNRLAKVTPLNAAEHQSWVDQFFAAQKAGFGSGSSRGYAEAWHETFGLMTDREDELILRLASRADQSLFCKDVVEGARRLREPLGFGSDLTLGPKHIAFSGSLPAEDWNTSLANSLVELGLPLLVLPSLAKQPPEIANDTLLQCIACCVPRYFTDPMEEPVNLLPTPWFDRYGEELRSRLRHLPGNYEYSMQKLARQLFPACLRIANWGGTYSGASAEEIMALSNDLCGHALRGLVLSVAGLAWHGLGVDAGCSHQTVIRVLEYLRTREPMTKSELLRGAHLDKRERNALLECFAAEGLVKIDGKVVSAVSYPEFVEGLYARKDLPQPVNHWEMVTGKQDAA